MAVLSWESVQLKFRWPKLQVFENRGCKMSQHTELVNGKEHWKSDCLSSVRKVVRWHSLSGSLVFQWINKYSHCSGGIIQEQTENWFDWLQISLTLLCRLQGKRWDVPFETYVAHCERCLMQRNVGSWHVLIEPETLLRKTLISEKYRGMTYSLNITADTNLKLCLRSAGIEKHTASLKQITMFEAAGLGDCMRFNYCNASEKFGWLTIFLTARTIFWTGNMFFRVNVNAWSNKGIKTGRNYEAALLALWRNLFFWFLW